MIGLVGISFKTAPVEIREKFSFSKEETKQLKEVLRMRMPEIGVVVLSTCNRTEVYCAGDVNHKLVFSILIEELSKFKDYSANMYEYFYFKKGIDAAKHLFEVAAGVDSLILGEDQIMGQLKEAYYYAEEIKSVNKFITRLFLKAIETGKKVRSETHINEGAASASSASIELAKKYIPDLSKASILIIGAGKTGDLVLSNLHKQMPKKIYVANRTISKAQELAQKHNGKAISLQEVDETIAFVDVVYIAVDAKEPLVKAESIYRAIKNRKSKFPLLFVDLSVPRNIDNIENSIENVHIFTIDDLKSIVESTNEQRKIAIVDANRIIDDMIDEYGEWMQTQAIVPVIKEIKQNFQNLNNQEFQGFVKVKSLEDKALVEEYANHITEKFARLMIKNLRELSKDRKSSEMLEIVSNLINFN